MKKYLAIILMFITFNVFSQSYPQIGMNKKEFLDSSSNIDSLDDGTIFIKSSTEMREYYYFFNDDNICFCIIINFTNQNKLNDYLKNLKKNRYKSSKNRDYWKKGDFFIKVKDVGLESPIVFIWTSYIQIPEDWDYHK